MGTPTRAARAAEVALAGIFLLALTDLQSEFSFGVPQFRLLYHPITIALAAGLALVLARGLLGRLGALKALAVFYVLAAAPLAIGLIDPDRTLDRAPLYLAEAIVVELAALRSWRNPLAFGAVAGFGAGSIGLAAEWGWSRVWMPFPWGESLLPEAAILAPLAGAAAGVLGARIALAFEGRPARPLGPLPARAAVGAALVATVVVLAIPLPRSGSSASATIIPFETTAASTRLRVRLNPPDAARDADWFRVVAFHGGSTEQVELRRSEDGAYVSERPLPVGGARDAALRLARGSTLAAATVYSSGREHGEKRTPLARRSQRFEEEHVLPPVSGFREPLQKAGYVAVAAIALLWLVLLSRALARPQETPEAPAAAKAPGSGA